MDSLAGLKTILIVFLVVALVGASPVFAKLNGDIILNPEAGCPATEVLVFLPEDGNVFVDGDTIPLKLSSEPDGLISNYNCASIASYQGGSSGLGIASYQASNDQIEQVPICNFLVSESASCGSYLVILEYDEDIIGGAKFEVLCACAVGGCVEPVNTFALLSPWLAVLGLVGCIGAAVVVAKKRRA